MAKRSVVPWNAPPRKRRKTRSKTKITLAQLPSSVRPEVKFSDRSISVSSGFFSTIQCRPDSFGAQGDDGDQMIGSEVFLRSFDYSLALPSTGWSTCRVSVLIPRDPSITPTSLARESKYSHREYIVLHDEFFSLNERNHCRIKKALNMKQKWNLTGTTITEGNVQIVVNLDGTIDFDHGVRTYFTDP